MQPFFSIIIPVYNVKLYLEECLNSILMQNFREYEVILVDDGSTDGSEHICDDYALKYGAIHSVHQENKGLSAARNKGISVSTGKYVLFLDSDDFLVGCDALERLNCLLITHMPDVLVYLPIEYDSTGKTVISTHRCIQMREDMLYNSKDVLDKLYSQDSVRITMAPTKIISRTYCIGKDLFFTEGIYHEDDEWIARMFLTYPTVIFSNFALYGYRHRENSIISEDNDAKIYKRNCDRLTIAYGILQNKEIRKHKAIIRYFARYFIYTLHQAKDMTEDRAENFMNYAQQYTNIFNVFLRSGDFRLIFLGLCNIVLGGAFTIRVIKKVL